MFENQERQASKKFYNKCSESSRSQFVFRTDIFRKLTLGATERGTVVFFFNKSPDATASGSRLDPSAGELFLKKRFDEIATKKCSLVTTTTLAQF